MTVTDEQREIARRVADQREARHEARGDARKWTPNRLNGADIHYVSILGEFAFYNQFDSTPPDLTFIARGDDGRDVTWRGYGVDVKTSTYTGPNQFLRVPCDRMHPEMIYVAAIYDADRDDVILLRWEWGDRLVEHDCVRKFGEHQTRNYVKLYRDCYPIATLPDFVTQPVVVQRELARVPAVSSASRFTPEERKYWGLP